MSANKMAACFASSDEVDGILQISSVFYGKIKKSLIEVDSENYQETSKSICAGFTKAALLDFRRKLFAIAYKFESEKPGGGAILSDANGIDKDDRARQDTSPVRGPGLVNRKSKPPVADDCVALAMYVKDPKGAFPDEVLKSVESGKKNSSEQPESPPQSPKPIANAKQANSDIDPGDKSKEKADHSSVQKRFERFVISEQYTDGSDNTGESIPVSVSALRETGTSTSDLIRLVNSATQTVESSFNEEREDESSVHNASGKPNEEDMSRKRTVKQRDNVSDFDRLMECEASLDALDKKYENAERKMIIFEHEHTKEMSVLKAEQSLLRKELKAIKERIDTGKSANAMQKSNEGRIADKPSRSGSQNTSKQRATESIDSTWDVNKCSTMIMTQDSQGEPVMTRATPVHTECAEEPVKRTQRGTKSLREYFPSRTDGKDGNRKQMPADTETTTVCDGDSESGKVDGASCSRCDNITLTSGKVYVTPNPRLVVQPGPSLRSDKGSTTRVSKQSGIEGYTIDSSSEEEQDTEPKRRRVDNVSKPPELESRCSTSEDGDDDADKTINNNGSGDNHDNDSPVREKYAKVVTKNGWTTPQKKGSNKLSKVDRKSLPKIAGLVDQDTKEYLVIGLSVKNFKTHRDLEEAVKVYCEERKIGTAYHRVITFKNNKKTVGCKITVKICEADRMFKSNFWPRGVHVREWFDERPTGKDKYFESSDDVDRRKSSYE